MSTVIVIGGGASGLLASAEAAKRGNKVILLERNEKLGKKLYITGKGRCNITNAGGREAFFAHVVRNPRFLYSAYAAYGYEEIIALLNGLGVETKIERGMRVYPKSDKSSDVISALAKYAKACGADVRLNCGVSRILTAKGRISGVLNDKGKEFTCDEVILCTGGVSYPSTGSTGDGYAFAKALGHTVIEPRTSLVPLETMEDWPYELSGLTLKNVTLSAFENGKLVYRELGEMLFAHFGVTGPLVLSASAYLDEPRNVRLEIDLKPGLSPEQLNKRLIRDIEQSRASSVKNAFSGLVPKSLLPVILKYACINSGDTAGELRKEQRQRLAAALKALPLTVKAARSFTEAVITRGGISVKEVNSKTMESKLVKGLYLAGEVLDVDALTGGFNLQIAWSTGALAGLSC